MTYHVVCLWRCSLCDNGVYSRQGALCTLYMSYVWYVGLQSVRLNLLSFSGNKVYIVSGLTWH